MLGKLDWGIIIAVIGCYGGVNELTICFIKRHENDKEKQ